MGGKTGTCMASNVSKLIRRQIELAKPLLQSLDIERARRGQDALGQIGARVLRDKVVYMPEIFDNFEAEWAYPLNGPEKSVILYLHGGAYTAGYLPYAKGFGGVLANTTRRNTLCIGYRLAPEHPFPAAVDDAVEAYLRIQEMFASQPIAIVGESAGGGLSFALTLRLKEMGVEMPFCVVALSPWTDLTCSAESYKTLADVDPSLFEDTLKQSAEYYSSGDYENPLVSPLYGDLSNMPDSLIFVGNNEILLDDSVHMAKALEDAGSKCELHIEDEMWHAYVLYGMPESKKALRRINKFMSERLNAHSKANG